MADKTTDKDFLAYLEECVNQQKSCEIRFRTVEGSVSVIRAHIVKLDHEGDRQIIETDAGFSIGVDQLLGVDGRVPDNFC